MITFAPSEEQLRIVEQVHAFAAGEIRPAARTAEESGRVPPGLAARAHALGLPLLEYPEALGGLGLGMLTRVLVEEELAWGDAGIAADLAGPGMAGYALLECGSAEQAAALLAPFAARPTRRGALIGVEDLAGSDAADMPLTTSPSGSGWHLEGNAFPLIPAEADLLVAAAATGSGAGEVFALARDLPGVAVGPRQPTLGLGAVGCVEVTLDCQVRAEDRLAQPEGLARALERAQLATAARAVGLARAAFEYAARYATERRAFGHPIAEHQAVAFMVADMGTAIDAARVLLWRAAWRFDAGDAMVEVGMAFAQALDAAMAVATDAVQILGGHGYMADHPVEKWMRDAKALALAWGTPQTAQRTIAALLAAP